MICTDVGEEQVILAGWFTIPMNGFFVVEICKRTTSLVDPSGFKKKARCQQPYFTLQIWTVTLFLMNGILRPEVISIIQQVA
jgi:hypothetical protein